MATVDERKKVRAAFIMLGDELVKLGRRLRGTPRGVDIEGSDGAALRKDIDDLRAVFDALAALLAPKEMTDGG